jgi:ABC-type glycerol-3-phosphate transport system permease component
LAVNGLTDWLGALRGASRAPSAPAVRDLPIFMAAPCLIVFLILQRSYVQGFLSGARRG